MAYEQIGLFDNLNKNSSTKKIRLIEFFSGIGSQAKSLEILGVDFENWKTCEWSKESIKAYKQIHHYNEHIEINLTKEELIEKVKGISSNYNEPMNDKQLERLSLEELKFIHECNLINHNLINISNVKGSDLEITETDKYNYFLCYSFPCQDLSNAGLRGGCEEGSGTRSSLLWEVGRILAECEEKPNLLIMENVPDIKNKKHVEQYKKWLKRLEDLGYQNILWDHDKKGNILNASEYYLPQNRRRCFLLSIRKDNLNEFNLSRPSRMRLKYQLKDFLETDVDEHYYLSKRMIAYITANNEKWTGNNNKSLINKKIASTLNTGEGSKRCDASNYICDDLPDNFDIKVIDTYNKCYVDEKVMNCIPATYSKSRGCVIEEGGVKIPEATKKGYAIATDGDGVYTNRPQQKRGCVQKGMIQTIKTNCDDIGVVVKKEQEEAPLRIRKLTACECYKLMGFTKTDYKRCREIQAECKCYHQAGDSICTTCLMAIFGNLLNIDYKSIIKNYVKELIND